MNDSGIERSICIDHHVYDELSDIRAKQRSRPQPFVNVTAKVTSEDYAALGWLSFGMVHHNSVTTDTGCQSCLAGLRVIHRLGLRESDLIPVTIRCTQPHMVVPDVFPSPNGSTTPVPTIVSNDLSSPLAQPMVIMSPAQTRRSGHSTRNPAWHSYHDISN